MRIDASVTTISWIPSEAITGMSTKMPFESGIAHYDQPPPDEFDDLKALQEADRFRFANHLCGWIEVQNGKIVGHGQGGGGLIGSTTLRMGPKSVVFQAVSLADICKDPVVTKDSVTFTQTAGGRTGLPAPRRVKRAPFVQFVAPLAWTSLSLTINADGTTRHELVGASPFPRHWVYDSKNKLSHKSGTIDFSTWYRRAFGKHSPWGERDSPTLSTAVETALERQLSVELMSGKAKPQVRKLKAGAAITEQGEEGDELFLVLDGVVRIEISGERIAEFGPGSMHGERAFLEGGRRTATVRAVTPCTLAFASAAQFDREALVELRKGHLGEGRG